jgi:hypothetical protein
MLVAKSLGVTRMGEMCTSGMTRGAGVVLCIVSTLTLRRQIRGLLLPPSLEFQRLRPGPERVGGNFRPGFRKQGGDAGRTEFGAARRGAELPHASRPRIPCSRYEGALSSSRKGRAAEKNHPAAFGFPRQRHRRLPVRLSGYFRGAARSGGRRPPHSGVGPSPCGLAYHLPAPPAPSDPSDEGESAPARAS